MKNIINLIAASQAVLKLLEEKNFSYRFGGPVAALNEALAAIKPDCEVTTDDIYWCILPSIEQENYENHDPRQPWKGKLVSAELPGGLAYRLHSINNAGEIDYDSNATACVSKPEKDLFTTKFEANQAYIAAMLNNFKWMANGLTNEIESLREFVAG